MKYIKAFVRDTCNIANEIVLAGKKDQQRDLSYGKPTSTNTQSSVMLCTRNIIVNEFESQDKAKIDQQETDGSERGHLKPKSLFCRSDLHVCSLAEDRGSCSCSLSEDVRRFSRVGSLCCCCSKPAYGRQHLLKVLGGIVDIPHSQSSPLDHVENGSDTDENDNAIPEVSRISISYDLEVGVIKDLGEEILCLGYVREIHPSIVQGHVHAITIAHGHIHF